jgi:putative spermidine/putrescine transport system substrate-binding protein
MNLLNAIDYGVVKRDDVVGPTFALEHGAVPYSFSNVLVYDSTKFPQGGPASWAAFWALRRFPGTRLLRRDAAGALDAAQMSLGKDPANLYPLDLRASLARVREIRRNTVFWTSGSESEQFIRTGEAVMGQIWHTRAKVLEAESNGRFRFVWNQGILQPGIFVSPRADARPREPAHAGGAGQGRHQHSPRGLRQGRPGRWRHPLLDQPAGARSGLTPAG